MENVKNASFLYESEGLALKTDGSVWTWDRDNAPAKFMDNVREARILGSTRYALKNDGSLWTWDYKRNPEDDSLYQTEPVLLMKDVSAFCYGLVLKTDGSVWYPGGKDGESEKVMDEAVVIESGGDNTYAAITPAGELYLWGDINGIESEGSISEKIAEPTLFMTGVKDVACGHEGILILKTDGTLWEHFRALKKIVQIPVY